MGGVGSLDNVVAVAGGDKVERFPAASYAAIVYE
jgi:hypothetical protein